MCIAWHDYDVNNNDDNIRFQRSEDGRYIKKICTTRQFFEQYREYFESEYNSMRFLFRNYEDDYRTLFPEYISFEPGNDSEPFLIMEYIEGETLEEKLSTGRRFRRPSPCQCLTNAKIFHLFEQLTHAQLLLCNAGLLQFDLNPTNIIVVNNDFDIRLVDFTDPFYTDPEIEIVQFRDENDRQYGKIDYHILPNYYSPAQELRQTAALLFTRLFYQGSGEYSDLYSRDAFLDSYMEYDRLLQCLDEEPDKCDVPLRHWGDWVTLLQKILM